jgi:hypothetical protein
MTPAHPRWRGLASERAIALPTAVMLLMIVLILALAAGTAAISAVGQSTRDRGTKRAVAAADAGLDTAIYRLNKMKPTSLACVVVGVPFLVLEPVLGTGWCPPVTESLGDGTSYTYQVSAGAALNLNGQGLMQRKVVVTGTANGVSRRIQANVGSLTGISVFGGYAVTSLSDLSLPSGTSIIGDAATDGSMHLFNCSRLLGNALVGPGESFNVGGNPTANCPGHSTVHATDHLVLNPVDHSASDANNNNRIGAVGGDPFVNILSTWTPASRSLTLRSASSLTLTGNTYSFCKLDLQGLSQLIIAPRLPTQDPLKIYIEDPSSPVCAGVSNAGTIRVSGTAQIVNLNATSDTFQISAVGNATTATSIRFENTISNLIGTIYAPQSTVALENANAILGSVAAKNVTLEDTARIQWHPSADITLDDLFPLFKRTSWVECTSKPTGSAPNSGCA